LENLRHGHGVTTYAANSKKQSYDGEWKQDKKSGNGTLIWKNGKKFTGDF